MFWLIFSILAILFAYLGKDEVSGTKNAVYFRIFLILLLSIVVGLGGEVGADHSEYVDRFNIVSKQESIDWETFLYLFFKVEKLELGDWLLFKVLYLLGFSALGMFLVVAVITNTFLVKVFYRFKCPVIAIMIFITSIYFYQEFNLIRQMMATSIVLYSLQYVSDVKPKRFIFTVLIAFFIHQSALVALIFYPIFKYVSWKFLKIILLSFWLYSLCLAFGILHIELSSIFSGYDLVVKYDSYMSNNNDVGIGVVKFPYVYNLLILLLFTLYKPQRKELVYLMYFVIGCSLKNISIQIPNIYRVEMLFSIIYCSYAPGFISRVKFDKIKHLSEILLWFLVIYHGRMIVANIFDPNMVYGTKFDSIFNILRH